jgi:hypothetical protein
MTSRRAFRSLVRVAGVVAATAGLDTVVRGGRSVAGQGAANAAVARAAAWRAAGPPHPLQRGLLAIELAAPPAVLAWQARLP